MIALISVAALVFLGACCAVTTASKYMIDYERPGTRRGSFALYGNSEDDIVPQHDDLRGSSTVARAPPNRYWTNTYFFSGGFAVKCSL